MFTKIDDDDLFELMKEGGDEGSNRKVPTKEERYKEDLDSFKAGEFKKERGCTDILWLIIYLLFLGSMIFLTNMGLQKGNIDKLLAPIDGDFKFCGIANETEGYNYTQFPQLLITDWSTENVFNVFKSAVCVNQCPNGQEDQVLECQTTSSVTECPTKDDFNMAFDSYMNICIPSEIPDTMKPALNAIKLSISQSAIGSTVNNIQKESKAIQISFALGFVYSIIFIYTMSIFAEYIAWICVILVQVALLLTTAGLGYMFKNELDELDKINQNPLNLDETELTAQSEESTKRKNWLLAFTIIVGLITLIFACSIYCCWSSLVRAIDVIDASSDFLAKTKRIILVPLLFSILTLIAVVLWFMSFTAVISMNNISAHKTIPQGKDLEWKTEVAWMALFMFFGILWVTAWLEYSSQFVIMVSATSYYFESNSELDGQADVGMGFKFALLHTGSIAIGAFIIAIVRLIRFLFMYIAKQAEKQSGENAVVVGIVRCAACCLACIEKICDYLNESAYAYQAVTGDSFCNSAWNMFLLQVRHMAKFSFANLIAKVFIFIGKLAITGANVMTCYFIMKQLTQETSLGVSYIWAPLCLVGAVSYIIASIFLSLLETAVLSLLTCLAVDIDINGEPKHGPPTFHEKSKKAEDKTEVEDEEQTESNTLE